MLDRSAAIALLSAHRPTAPAELIHHAAMLDLLQSLGDPFSRTHTNPGHFTASAFVTSPDGDALLLIHHRNLDRWLQPGGHIEPGDVDLLAAARRELDEEVGLSGLPLATNGAFDLDVHSIPAHGNEPAHRHFDVRFLFRARSLALHASDEVNAARWFPLTSIATVQTDDSVMRAVRKLGAT